MIQSIASFGLREIVADKVKQIEGVHVVEDRRIELIEDLLIKGVEVFAVIDNDLTVGCSNQPLVVGLQVRELKRIDCSVDGHE